MGGLITKSHLCGGSVSSHCNSSGPCSLLWSVSLPKTEAKGDGKFHSTNSRAVRHGGPQPGRSGFKYSAQPESGGRGQGEPSRQFAGEVKGRGRLSVHAPQGESQGVSPPYSLADLGTAPRSFALRPADLSERGQGPPPRPPRPDLCTSTPGAPEGSPSPSGGGWPGGRAHRLHRRRPRLALFLLQTTLSPRASLTGFSLHPARGSAFRRAGRSGVALVTARNAARRPLAPSGQPHVQHTPSPRTALGWAPFAASGPRS